MIVAKVTQYNVTASEDEMFILRHALRKYIELNTNDPQEMLNIAAEIRNKLIGVE